VGQQLGALKQQQEQSEVVHEGSWGLT